LNKKLVDVVAKHVLERAKWKAMYARGASKIPIGPVSGHIVNQANYTHSGAFNNQGGIRGQGGAQKLQESARFGTQSA
jgi:hypothetical protein